MLEEDFLDLLGLILQKAPIQEIWQQDNPLSATDSSPELAANSMLQVWHGAGQSPFKCLCLHRPTAGTQQSRQPGYGAALPR